MEDEEETSDFEVDDRPKYFTILEEEEYEDEGDTPQGVSPLQDNFEPEDPTPDIIGWNPGDHEYFRLQ